ncbi:hypothetical protein K432DRAFT_350951 [Lepidopterella palustris CBS 459.81]|uniref:Uncharacterized protein n=1 Tax=Lepidopterella palustris CBS 459.81 TaxID=1314670 RepID=A0A8E2JGH8_9PEZI|nr:hypothetical protein K432DRAFT_350951 [Lepidopterella palustris CBS 459.81]
MRQTALSTINPSPKRKRDTADPSAVAPTIPPFAPRLNTSTPASTPISSENSPRSVIADQFRDLKIKATIPVLNFAAEGIDAAQEVRKKAKRNDSIQATMGSTMGGLRNISPMRGAQDSGTTFVDMDGYSDAVLEIPETAHMLFGFKSTNITSRLPAFTSSSSYKFGDEGSNSPPKPRSHPRRKSPSPPLPSSLTWQDGEITGHLADPSTDPDDDGTGINGIGFKPTPALAYARVQRRRQQVLEWRAREAKEARQKRSERRRRGVGGSGGTSSGAEDAKGGENRVVRFV